MGLTVHPLTIELPLQAAKVATFRLIQWSTTFVPPPGPPFTPEETEVRRTLIRSILKSAAAPGTDQPFFLVTPEISTPVECLDDIVKGFAELKCPAVGIVGLPYLSPDAYRAIVGRSSNPDPGRWTTGLTAGSYVNCAAVIIRDGSGSVSTWIQPKCQPAEVEQAHQIFACEEILVFRHVSGIPGDGLNFCVQICADFGKVVHITELRKVIARAVGGDLRLDLLFVLQHNPDQNAPQFCDGTNAYFAPPDGSIDPISGAVVFVNNASPTPGRSARWGESQLRFRFDGWRMTGGSATFRFWRKSGYAWQSVIFRNSSESVYGFDYKPLSLVSRIPLADPLLPLRDAGRAAVVPPDAGPPTFSPICSHLYWLECEWIAGGPPLFDAASTDAVKAVVQQMAAELSLAVLGRYGESTWHARTAIYLYFIAHPDRSRFPRSDAKEFEETEPYEWCDDARRGARSWFSAAVMLKIAAAAANVEMDPEVSERGHAQLAARPVVFLWGDGLRAEVLVLRYKEALRSRDLLQGKTLIILVGTATQPPQETLRSSVLRPIDRGTAPAGAGAHLAEDGNSITTGESWDPAFVYDGQLLQALGQDSAEAFTAELSTTLRGAVSGI